MIGRSTVGTISLAVVLCSAVAHGTSIAPVTIHDLFKEADVVAVVHVSSGDEEVYPIPVYKARVTEALKGVTQGGQILFGGCTEFPSDKTILCF